MTEDEATQVLGALVLSWPRAKPMTTPEAAAWRHDLAPLDFAPAMSAINLLRAGHGRDEKDTPYFPHWSVFARVYRAEKRRINYSRPALPAAPGHTDETKATAKRHIAEIRDQMEMTRPQGGHSNGKA